MGGSEIFLDELNKQNNRELDLKNSLENKSNSLITVSGIVIPLLFAFSIFIIEKIDRSYHLFWITAGILSCIIILNISSLVFAVWSAKIRHYRYPFTHFNFFDNTDKINVSAIKKYTNSQENEFNEMLIKAYLKSNKRNFETNEKKAKYIRIGQYIFIGSLILVSVLVVMVFLYSPPLISTIQ